MISIEQHMSQIISGHMGHFWDIRYVHAKFTIFKINSIYTSFMSRPAMSILINRHTAHVPLCSNEIRDIKNVCTVKLTWTYHHDAVYCLIPKEQFYKLEFFQYSNKNIFMLSNQRKYLEFFFLYIFGNSYFEVWYYFCISWCIIS